MQVAIWKLSHIKDPDVPKPSEENGWTKNHDEVLEPLWQWEIGASHKRRLHIRRAGGGSGKSGHMRTGEGGWLAKCGRPLRKKIMATVFVKLTQIIWQHVCI